jgi:hypothetical protein
MRHNNAGPNFAAFQRYCEGILLMAKRKSGIGAGFGRLHLSRGSYIKLGLWPVRESNPPCSAKYGSRPPT